MTVAMYLARYGVVPPKEWQHNPSLTNDNNETVAILLASNGIVPPKEW